MRCSSFSLYNAGCPHVYCVCNKMHFKTPISDPPFKSFASLIKGINIFGVHPLTIVLCNYCPKVTKKLWSFCPFWCGWASAFTFSCVPDLHAVWMQDNSEFLVSPLKKPLECFRCWQWIGAQRKWCSWRSDTIEQLCCGHNSDLMSLRTEAIPCRLVATIFQLRQALCR